MRITPEMMVEALAGKDGEHLDGMGYLCHRGDGEYVIDATIDMAAAAGRLNEMLHEREDER